MQNQKRNGLVASLLTLALTACGSGGGGGAPTGATTSTPVSDRIASVSIVGPYSDSGTLSNSDDTRDYTYRETGDTFGVRASGNILVMTVNGTNYNLTLDASSTQRYSGAEEVFLWSPNDFNAQVINGTHTGLQGTYVYYETDTTDYASGAVNFDIDFTFGYASVGIQTPPSVVASQTATATFEGAIDFDTRPRKRTLSAPDTTSFENYYGIVSMEVDFDAGTISGTAPLQRNRDDNPNLRVDAGIVTFAPAPIVGNGFAGTFTLNGDLRRDAALTGNPVGNYAGNFFGSAADDIAGTMQLNGANASGAVFGYGGFRGDRQ